MRARAADAARAFLGAKIALICGDRTVTYLRDDRADIPFPGQWDLPGGGREGRETPEACALREAGEEFGLAIPPQRIVWRRSYGSGAACTFFFVAPITAHEVAAIRFGDEGQHWRMMPVAEFLAHPNAVAHLQSRLAAFWTV